MLESNRKENQLKNASMYWVSEWVCEWRFWWHCGNFIEAKSNQEEMSE